jgi:aspartate ammonia-lyase
MRVEEDEFGKVEIPDSAMWDIQTQRACSNFALDYKKVNLKLVYSIVKIKKAAAITHEKFYSGLQKNSLKRDLYRAIVAACDKILAGEADNQFVVDALQGGAGTSTNMNVNEVTANIALGILGKQPGSFDVIHPLDDVNRGQSTNDVYPTALRIAAIELLRELSSSCAKLQEELQKKENEFEDIKKLGRTELMDAIPVTLGAEFGAYAQAISRDRWRLYKIEERLRQVNLGGAAVGLAGKEEKQFRISVIEKLRELTGIGLAAAEYPMDLTQNNDVFVEVSGLLKALAVNVVKIANDLRLMNSGPRGGIGEIRLAPVQKGSTIMPGKVNPVIAEMVIQAGIKVFANDYAVTEAASRGEFELNAFSPIIADSILESLSILNKAVLIFCTKCIHTVAPDKERCELLLNNSFAFAPAYIGRLGYDNVNKIIMENRNSPEKAKEILEKLLQEKL